MVGDWSVQGFLAAADAGILENFLDEAARQLDHKGIVTLAEDVAKTSDDGRFDLSAATSQFSRLSYAVQDLLRELLPRLKLSLPEMLDFLGVVDAVPQPKGKSYLKMQLFDAWVGADKQNPEQAIQAFNAEMLPVEYLRPALFSGLAADQSQYVPQTIDLLESGTEPAIDNAAFTLGRYESLDPSSLPIVVERLKARLVRSDESVRSEALAALIAIAIRDSRFEESAIAAIAVAHARPDAACRAAVARELMGKRKDVSPAIGSPALAFLEETTKDDVEVIETIDFVVQDFLGSPLEADALRFVEGLICNSDISVSSLDSFSNAILSADAAWRDDLLVRWIADGRRELIRALYELISSVHGQPLTFELDFSKSGLVAESAIAAARKLTEAFFILPVTLCSLLVSLLSTGPKGSKPAVARLLFDPVLINYWEKPRDYLVARKAAASAPLAAALDGVLSAHDCYVEAIEAADPIPELWPSERHRFLAALKEAEEARSITRAAEAQSVLMSLVTKSVILYGDAAIVGVHSGEKTIRQESRMQTLEHSYPLPRLEAVDRMGQWYRRELLSRGEDFE